MTLETAKLLEADNHSAQAQANIARSQELGNLATQVLTIACVDARGIFSNRSLQDRAMGAAQQPWILRSLLESNQTVGLIVMGHTECGAGKVRDQITKGQIKLTERAVTNSAVGYVSENLTSADPFIQTSRSALLASRETSLPVLALVEDIQTGNLRASGFFDDQRNIEITGTQEGEPAESVVEGNKLNDKMLAQIYGSLKARLITGSFQQVLDDIKLESDRLIGKYPDFSRRQQVQDPGSVVATSILYPLSARYPDTFGDPNSAYVVTVDGLGAKEYGSNTVQNARKELDYPFSHHLKVQKDRDLEPNHHHSFTHTRRLLVETEDMKTSERLAKYFLRMPTLKELSRVSPIEVIIAQSTIEGTLQKIDQIA